MHYDWLSQHAAVSGCSRRLRMPRAMLVSWSHPAMAFYVGCATSCPCRMGSGQRRTKSHRIALDSWKPTLGTRLPASGILPTFIFSIVYKAHGSSSPRKDFRRHFGDRGRRSLLAEHHHLTHLQTTRSRVHQLAPIRISVIRDTPSRQRRTRAGSLIPDFRYVSNRTKRSASVGRWCAV